MPHVYPHTIPTRFPRKNDAPEVQPLPTTSSTWSLADTEEHADENTEPHPEPPGQVTPGEGESRSQGPSTVNTRVDGYEPRADTDNPNQSVHQDNVPVPGMTVPASRLIDLQADLHAPSSLCARTNYPERASTEKAQAMV